MIPSTIYSCVIHPALQFASENSPTPHQLLMLASLLHNPRISLLLNLILVQAPFILYRGIYIFSKILIMHDCTCIYMPAQHALCFAHI